MVDQYVQVGTLNEIETFHQFLMHDLYREEKPINFKANINFSYYYYYFTILLNLGF